MIKRMGCICAALWISAAAFAVEEFTDGRIKLVLDDRLGRFQIYYMTDVEKRTYEPMLWDKDRKTSFVSVFIDGKIYIMGESASFKTTIRGTETRPALVFESKDVSVTEEFSFIRTASSGVTNGIRIDYKVENWSARPENVGLRLLLDTFLGEGSVPHFRTDLRPIETETLIDRTTADQWWLSRNNRYGLMGSIFVNGLEAPDFLHFSNWKRLNETRWKPELVSGRNFNALPFSTKDSAICYFMDVGRLERWQKRGMTVLLAAEDMYGFDYAKSPQPVYIEPIQVREEIIVAAPIAAPLVNTNVAQAQNAAPVPARLPGSLLLPSGRIRIDLQTLRELIAKVDGYIYLGTPVTEEELKAMEGVLQRLKLQYGSIF